MPRPSGRRLRVLVVVLALSPGGGGLVALVWGLVLAEPLPGVPCPDRVGPDDGPASFLVVPDVQKGLAAFEEMMDRARGLAADLAVFTGDMVCHSDEGHYRLFLRAWARAGPGTPALFAPGNHDLEPEGDLPPRRDLYRRAFGPEARTVRLSGAALLTGDDALGPPDPTALADLDRRLAVETGARHRFLFLHVPPLDGADRPRPGFEPLVEVCRRRAVTAVFAGHVRGWRDRVVDGVRWVDNGEGADHDGPLPRGTARLLEVRLGAEGYSVRSHLLPRRLALRVEAEHLALAHPGRCLAVAGASALAALALGLASPGRGASAPRT
ncbi:MAG: metallophosphoesterase [Planctomycetes bacterium]|nr:metallophosphoesterase [Planctomycetota bacterium]